MELVDTPDLGSGAERCGGSSPPSRTKYQRLNPEIGVDKCGHIEKVWTKCGQIERKNMEKIEGWDPHPTRKNTFIIPSEFICLIV